MKIIHSIVIALLLIIFALPPIMGQENSRLWQEVIVKTRGRMVRNQHIHGTGLVGTTVNIYEGNSYIVKDTTGSFIFPTPSPSFKITSVQKKGFQLVDADLLNRSYQYSKNPLYIIMETPEQQAKDLLESERQIRRTLQEQLRKREDELEELKDSYKISEEEYEKALRKLYDDENNNEKLISEMVKK